LICTPYIDGLLIVEMRKVAVESEQAVVNQSGSFPIGRYVLYYLAMALISILLHWLFFWGASFL